MREPCSAVRPVKRMKRQQLRRSAVLSGHLSSTGPSSPQPAGLLVRSGNKKCFSEEEEDLLIKLHALLGNRWSLIAGRLPGRTDKEVRSHWNWQMRSKLKRMGIDPDNHRATTFPLPDDHQHQQWPRRPRPAKHLDCPPSSNSKAEDIARDCVSDASSGCRARQDKLPRGLNLELTLSTPCLYFGEEELADR